VTLTSAEPIEQERVPQADFATHRKGARSPAGTATRLCALAELHKTWCETKKLLLARSQRCSGVFQTIRGRPGPAYPNLARQLHSIA